jgi:hypothetical protein
MLTHALQLCPTVDRQLPWYELKRSEAKNYVYTLGDENSGEHVAVGRQASALLICRPGAGTKGEYRWPTAMHDQVVNVAN